jgi:hypothetical protein
VFVRVCARRSRMFFAPSDVGGWINVLETVEVGIVSTYQSPSTIEWSHLQRAVDFDFHTMEGRQLCEWAKVILQLRQLVKNALDKRTPAEWQKVINKLV